MTSHLATPFASLTRHMRRALRPRSEKIARRGFESGGGGRRWEGAQTLVAPVQSTLAARASTRSRAAAAYANTPYGRRAVETWVAALAGKAWQTRSAHPDLATRRAINDDFEAMIGAVLIGLVRSLVRDGEAFLRIRLRADGTIRLQLLPVEQIDGSLTRELEGGARIVSGIEFDGDGEVVAYHVLPEAPDTPFGTWGQAVRIPAQDMLHIFDQLYPGQVRGISWLAPALLKMRDRDEFSDAYLMAAKVSVMHTVFFRDNEGALLDGAEIGSALNLGLEPGVGHIIPGGVDVEAPPPPPGPAQPAEFVKIQDREIAAALGLTFEQLTGDLGEANYSSARVGLLEFRRRAEMLQKSLIEGQFLRPLWRRWVDLQVLSGAIPADDAGDYSEVRFIGPGWPWVDPRSEIEAEVAAMAAGLKSREEIVAARGRDIDEVDEEIARDGRHNPGSVE